LLPEVDSWLARKLEPVAFTAAVREYEATRPEPQPDADARQEIAECAPSYASTAPRSKQAPTRPSSRAG
jgi:hypothetical protein